MKASHRSTLHFAMVVLGTCIVLAGVLLWFGLVDHDHHYVFEGEYETMPDEWERPSGAIEGAAANDWYADDDDLDDRDREIVHRAMDGESFTFQSVEEVPPTLVEDDDRFYHFEYYRTFDWTDPGMAGATLTVLAGFWLAFEGIRREQFDHVPVYRNLFRWVTGPFRRA